MKSKYPPPSDDDRCINLPVALVVVIVLMYSVAAVALIGYGVHYAATRVVQDIYQLGDVLDCRGDC